MDHDHLTPGTGSSGVDALALALRLALLLTTACLAGAGLLTPLAGELTRRLRTILPGLGALSALLAIGSLFAVPINPVALAVHVLLALAVPVLVRWPRFGRWAAVALGALVVLETSAGRSGVAFAADLGYVAGATVWFGFAFLGASHREWRTGTVRPGPLALTLGGLLVLAGGVELALSGPGFDRRLYTTAFGITVLLVVTLPLVVTALAVGLRRDPGRTYRVGALGVGPAFLAWSALAVLPAPPPLPVPGVPLLADAGGFPVLVSPQRPGHNLVHFPASAGTGLAVATGAGPVAQAVTRPGAEGTWADVVLPPGRSELRIQRGDATSALEVDAGTEPGPGVADDSPECATAALGGLVAGHRDVLTSCPADALSPEDSGALAKLVDFLATRKPAAITLVADSSPRGTAAAALVRDRAASHGLRVQAGPGPDTALLVVAGWTRGYAALKGVKEAQQTRPTHQYGLYLAPWLLNAPLVNAVAGSSLPLRFDPREPTALAYAVAVGDAFGGESPTVGGFARWLGPSRGDVDGGVQIYASAQVNAMPTDPREPHAPGMVMNRDYAGQWVPDGTVVPISAVLR
ncbi:hypothetical protein [Amycolatopsis sp. NPDC051903]|uniref:hypothetical protein n=1 Tax=Amycolatopsis sp. NPDC051903 TaxID=3363936 RepID=UPI0037B47008